MYLPSSISATTVLPFSGMKVMVPTGTSFPSYFTVPVIFPDFELSPVSLLFLSSCFCELPPLQPSARQTRATTNISAVRFLSMLLLLTTKGSESTVDPPWRVVRLSVAGSLRDGFLFHFLEELLNRGWVVHRRPE